MANNQSPSSTRPLGRTGLAMPTFGLGGAPLGNSQVEVGDDEAFATVAAAFEAGVRYFDVAPLYGNGLAEHRFGEALRRYHRDDYVLSTKVGRVLRRRDGNRWDTGMFLRALPFAYHYDYSYDGIMRSVEDSLQRMGTNRFDILYVHNIDTENLAGAYLDHFETVVSDGYRALEQLKREGVTRAIGVGNNHWRICQRFGEQAAFDCFMIASGSAYSMLITDPLDEFLPFCAEKGISVVVGGAFNSGILATGAVPEAQFVYGPAPEATMEKVRRIEQVCARHGVALAAAALQFPLAHQSVVSVVQGGRSIKQIAENVSAFSAEIPAAFWEELKHAELLRADAPIPTRQHG